MEAWKGMGWLTGAVMGLVPVLGADSRSAAWANADGDAWVSVVGDAHAGPQPLANAAEALRN